MKKHKAQNPNFKANPIPQILNNKHFGFCPDFSQILQIWLRNQGFSILDLPAPYGREATRSEFRVSPALGSPRARPEGLGFRVFRAERGRGFTRLEVCDGRPNTVWKNSAHGKQPRKSAAALFRRLFRGKLLTGFTLIEMLVVVAIAGMLLSGVMVLFQGARAKARDATREQHIKTTQNALALYVNTRGKYPVYDGALTGTDTVSTELKSDGALPEVPKDPLSSGVYQYSYTSDDGTTYTLSYYLETDTISGKSSGLNTAGP